MSKTIKLAQFVFPFLYQHSREALHPRYRRRRRTSILSSAGLTGSRRFHVRAGDDNRPGHPSDRQRGDGGRRRRRRVYGDICFRAQPQRRSRVYLQTVTNIVAESLGCLPLNCKPQITSSFTCLFSSDKRAITASFPSVTNFHIIER